MNITILTSFFGWCSVINLGLLLLWSLFFLFAPDLVYRTQKSFVSISRERFDLFMYSFIGLFKLLVLIFNIVPWIALRIIG